MRITPEYDNEEQLLRIIESGQFDLDNDKEAMEKHIENQVIFARAQYPQRKGAKLVYAVNCQLGFKLTRMPEILIGDEETDQKVFYDYTEAEKWLINTA